MSVGVGVGGPVALWSSTQGEQRLHERDEQPAGASFPRTRPSAEPTVALAAYTDSDSVVASTVVVVPALQVAHPHLQQLPDGSFLVVGARCGWTDAGPEQNAMVIGHDGRIIRRGCLGDGLQHVQVAEDGTIWTGYFDEGVFGDGPDPLGAAGIVAWSSAPLPMAQVHCRGSVTHFFSNSDWYTFDLNELE